jgi:hypothetical protein
MIVVNKKMGVVSVGQGIDKETHTHTHTPFYFVHVAIVNLSRRECVLLLNQNHVFYRKVPVFYFIKFHPNKSLPNQILNSGRNQ